MVDLHFIGSTTTTASVLKGGETEALWDHGQRMEKGVQRVPKDLAKAFYDVEPLIRALIELNDYFAPNRQEEKPVVSLLMRAYGSPYGQYLHPGLFLAYYYPRMLNYIISARLEDPAIFAEYAVSRASQRHEDRKRSNNYVVIMQRIDELIKKYASALREGLEDLLVVLSTVKKCIERLSQDLKQYKFIKKVEVVRIDLNKVGSSQTPMG